MKARFVTPVLVAGFALAVVGCGATSSNTLVLMTPTATSPPAAAGDQPADPCSLLDDATVSRLVGRPASRAGAAVPQARGLACTWSFTDPEAVVPEGQVVVTTFRGPEFFVAGTIGPPLAGLGEEAQSDPSTGTVLARSGEDVVEVQVLSAAHRDQAVALTREALGAL